MLYSQYEIGIVIEIMIKPTIVTSFIFPTALIAVVMGNVNFSMIIETMIRRVKMTAYSGTFFNHNSSKYGVSINTGIEKIESRNTENFALVTVR